MLNSRAHAAQIIARVVNKSLNLNQALSDAFTPLHGNDAIAANDRSFIQQLCYGTLRFYLRLEWLAKQLLQKPLVVPDAEVSALILIGLYQLLYLTTPAYAALSATVEASKQLKKAWASKLINALLRNFERQRTVLLAQAEHNLVAHTAHPAWLLKRIQQAYAQDWQTICLINNQQAPLTLRVNQQKISRADYLQKLPTHHLVAEITPLSSSGLCLQQAVAVEILPGFATGEVSVQDEAAQLAATLLDLQVGQRVLDACAAPGGKTAHILEIQPTIKLVAVEISARRAEKIHENLRRLDLRAEILIADAADSKQWWDNTLFDRILLDAPCSATGVIRRHPEIKLLLHSKTIDALVATQQRLLAALWPLLKSDGILLYATCSILPEENQQQIAHFLRSYSDARLLQERQLLSQLDGHDGFYYASMKKIS